MYFRQWSAILFIILAIVNIFIIYNYDENRRKNFSILTSALISMFTPVVSSEEPHLFQLTTRNYTQETVKQYTRDRRNLSSKLAIINWIIIFISNVALLVLLEQDSLNFNPEIVLKRKATIKILYILLVPVSLSALIVSICFKKRQSNDLESLQIPPISNFNLREFVHGCWTRMASLKSIAITGVIVSVLMLIIGCISIVTLFGPSPNEGKPCYQCYI